MSTARTTSAGRGLAGLALSFIALAALALAVQSTAAAESANEGCIGAYRWPVRPFDEAHPVRANFGDPRTRFSDAKTSDALLRGDGTFSFHQGVDISAPDGAPVYAVASGRIVRARGGRVTVDCGNGRSIQYWHVHPVVRPGQRAVAGETVLGFIQPKREHVHLTHLEHSRPVNPLAPGHLVPYEDTTKPVVHGIAAVRQGDRVRFVIDTTDTPALPVPGRWNGFPVTPALLTWRIVENGSPVVGKQVAWDVRSSVPRNDRFWDEYARGTHQNWPIFAGRKYKGVVGSYRFVTEPINAPGMGGRRYAIVVTAEDTGGNRGQVQALVTALGVSRELSGS